MAEDNDIKIYGKKDALESTAEFLCITEDILRNVNNGNRDKATRLGTEMAKIKAEDGVIDLSGCNLTPSLLSQIRILLTFTAEYCVQKTIPMKFLSDEVSTAIYNYLKTNEKEYYDKISDGAAFSFYLVALKKDGETVQNIGEQFAMLCGTDNPETAEIGKKVFIEGEKYFTELINTAGFVSVE